MITKGIIKKGEYFDSVTLMIVSRKLSGLDGVIDSSIVMGTAENKAILESAGLLIETFDGCSDTDLLVAIKAESQEKFENALESLTEMLKDVRNKKDDSDDFHPVSLDGALSMMPDANLAIISIAGRYAALEAEKALENGLHVMIFSDNVSIEDEKRLKEMGRDKNLLVMGPDCGTAIINGIPLAFANVVEKGDIGIVAASGTGLQEVSSVIAHVGAGISQAIGTGGRDVKEYIGGIMFLEAMDALAEDKQTKVIVLVSKPPHASVLQKIAEKIDTISKPIVAILIGGDMSVLREKGVYTADTLEKCALIASALSKGTDPDSVLDHLKARSSQLDKIAEKEMTCKEGRRFIRGLFSGGTLCDETQLILKNSLGDVYSNTPLNPAFKLKDIWKSVGHTIVDLGDDDFTVGRPHPMIDFSLRNRRIASESEDSETAVILLDVVLGYGSNMDPAGELSSSIRKARETAPGISIICSITGTAGDPQNRSYVEEELTKAGAIVMPTNAAATQLAEKIILNCNRHL
ncbi:acyl-CoA synthetase FdrA [Myxococcota bacterium]|nr:acyl-CoA synthetase FdrA [Myxococcota bacterium]MBU1381240.1 acyl-CoA synthetase FdrA [Myxococcota bacterium]MBU1498876.1 acyl-CoA synthetase FdrA [Myxococcota bacterium]